MSMVKADNRGRESGIELLRILAMIFIVFNHFASHSGSRCV